MFWSRRAPTSQIIPIPSLGGVWIFSGTAQCIIWANNLLVVHIIIECVHCHVIKDKIKNYAMDKVKKL